MARILVVDDQKGVSASLSTALRAVGHEVETAASAEEGESVAREEPFDVVLTDVRLPGRSGMDLLEMLKRESPGTEVIVTGITGSRLVVQAIESN